MRDKSSHEALTETQLRRLLQAGRSLVGELDLEMLLEEILATAQELTGAQYAALGILDKEKQTLERFLNLGIDAETRRGIGPLPQGRGVLGELIRNPKPLRLEKVGDHPRSFGFPPGHPPMDSFVGVPIQIRGEAYGNIYLTEKTGGEQFDERDEAMLVVLAEWASVAIDNARAYEENERRRVELERAVQALEATVALSRFGAAGADLDDLHELISKRGRALVESGSLILISPGSGRELKVSATAGETLISAGTRVVSSGNHLLESSRRDGLVHHLHGELFDTEEHGFVSATSSLLVHLDHRGQSQGYLVALEAVDRDDFTPDDELLFQSFATSAASSLATARDVERDRLRTTIDASEQERRRWAMELHDETLQDLGALKVMHESALSLGDPETMRATLTGASSQLEETINSLESLIQELRPASLDALGVAAALDTLIDRTSTRGGLASSVHIDLAHERGDEPTRLQPQLESTIYRIVQESLNNAVKHANATRISVSVIEYGDRLTIFIEDDGDGFAPSEVKGDRFGLHGMKERVDLVEGEVEIDSSKGAGTRVEVHLPVRRRSSDG